MKKSKKLKYIAVILLLSLTIIGLLSFSGHDKYKGLVRVTNPRITSKLLSSVGNALIENEEVKGNSTILYDVNFTLDEVDGITHRDAIINASLSDEESRYARFKSIDGPGITSTISDNGKEIEILVENVELGREKSIRLKLVIENAPNDLEINPVIKVREATGEYTNLNTERIVVSTNSVEGVVKDENDLPVSNIEVGAFKDNREIKRTYTNENGEYILTDLDAGAYVIDVIEDIYEVTSSKNIEVDGKSILNLKIKEVDSNKIDIHKYIENLKLIVDGKATNYSYNDSDKVVETIRKAETISGEIEYKLVIKNIGDKDAKVDRLIDEASSGLKLKKESNIGWEEVDGTYYYRPIEGTTLKKNEKREIKLVLEIENTKEAKTYLNKMTTKGELYETVVYILDGEKYREEKILEGDKLVEPIIEDDNFSGWYTDINKTNKYNFNNRVNKDMILYGTTEVTKYNVKFIKDDTIVSTTTVNKNEKAIEIAGPEKEGYDFKYWSLNQGGEAYNFDTPVTSDIELYAVYEIKHLDVIFYDGNNEYTRKTVNYNELIPISSVTNPTKEHFSFKYWSLTQNGNPYDFTTPVTTNINLYSVYEINKYTVRFIDNGVTIKEEMVDANTLVQPVSVSKDGYNFKHWIVDGNPYDFTNPIVKDTTFTSVYEIITYTITYNEEISGNPSTYTVETDTFTLNNPSKTGYTFLGWTGSNGNIPESNVTIPKGSTGNKTYNTNYNEITYDIAYNLNGGTLDNTETNRETYTITTDTFTLHNPSKVGYTFIGWTGSNGNVPSKTVTIEQGTTGNKSYEANYKINNYDVEFYDNNTKVKTVSVPYQSNIPSGEVPVVTKEGYEFTYWSLKDIASAFDFSIPITFNLKLYSNYKIQEKEVLFNDENRVTTVKVNWGDRVSPIESQGKEGYTFSHWSLERDGETFNFNTVITSPTILYAVYQIDTYTITYNLDGGSASNRENYSVETDDFTLNNPTKLGYTFKGWSGTDLTGDSNKTVTITKGSTGNRIYNANYTIDTYTITYNLNGGSLEQGKTNRETYTIETDTFTLYNPSKVGYTFIGWSENTEEATTTKTITKGTTGNKVIDANYEINTYIVNFIDQGSPYGQNEEVEYNQKATRPSDPSKEGYTFKHWSLEENGEEYDFNAKVTKNITLYSVYEINKYDVIFIDQGITYHEDEVNYNEKATKIANPNKEGYTFRYWSLEENGEEYNFNTLVTSNITLYSVYEINTYTVKFIDEDLPYGEDETINYNQKAIKPTDPNKEGYTFRYWSLSKNGTEYDFNTLVTSNITLYSVYEINTYTVRYMNGENQFAIEEVEYNQKATIPSSNPTKEHNVFIGWTLNNELYNFNSLVTSDLTLYSSFEEVVRPTITHSPTTWVSDHVTVTISSNHNDYTYMYKIGDGEYAPYTSPFIVEENTTIYAYSIKSNIYSIENTSEIDNIDKINPVNLSIEEGTITPVSIDIDYTSSDLESGVKTVNIYVNGSLYVSNVLKESVTNYDNSISITGLEELTDYTIKLEVLDLVGNTSYIEETITTTAKTYVARIVSIDNTTLETPIKFETLKEAIEYNSCLSNSCTIEMMEDVVESNSILNGQDITLDLKGKTITGETNITFNNSGIFKVIDTTGTGEMINTTGTAIYSTNYLEIGVDDDTVSVTSPVIDGTIYGTETTGTFNFYDGIIKGVTANRGTITKTPYLYNASISEDLVTGKQVETLHQLADAVARINTTYYTQLGTAIDKSKIGSIEKINPPKEVDIKNNLVVNSDYPFIVVDNEIVSTNTIGGTTGTSYLKLDLTNYTEDQILSFDFKVYENEYNGYIYLTESEEIPTSDPLAWGNNIEKHFEILLTRGKVYYLHMKYGELGWRGGNKTKVSNVTLQNVGSSSVSEEATSTWNYTFELDEDGYYSSTNVNIRDTAASYIPFDLTNEVDDKYLVLYAKYPSGSYGAAAIYLTDSPTRPNYDLEEGRIVYTGQEIYKKYIVTLEAGKINYLHLAQTDGRGNRVFKVKVILTDSIDDFIETPNITIDEELRINEDVDRVELLKDITLSSKAEIDEKRSVVLDLNGHTLTTNSNDYIIDNYGVLEIVDTDFETQPERNWEEYQREVERTEREYAQAVAQYNADLEEYNGFVNSGQIFYKGGYKENYTGNIKAITIPVSGTYKLEAWGASGGYRTNENMAGLGGYTSGEIYLNKDDIIFVNVGSSGMTGGTDGGYNGGGSRETFPGGGGATDVRINGTTLYNRILVAAGGASDGSAGQKGGNAGGLVGSSRSGGWGSYGEGANQEAAGYNGSFGQGGAGIAYAGGYGGAGGGGWYGGGACHPDGSGDDDGGGGGGSSFAYDGTNTVPEGYDVGNYVITNASLISGSEEMPTHDGTSTMTGNKGDGFFKITLIDEEVIEDLIEHEDREYTTREEPIAPVKEIPIHDTDYELNGNITSSTNSIIRNRTNAELTITDANINTNLSGSYSAIINDGKLTLDENAYINVNTNSNIGILNRFGGDILYSEGNINVTASNGIGIKNESYIDDDISGLKINTSDNTQIAIADYTKNDTITYSDLELNGSGLGIYIENTKEVTIKDSNIVSTANNAVSNTNASGKITLKDSYVKGQVSSSGTKTYEITGCTLENDRSYVVAIYNGSDGVMTISNTTSEKDNTISSVGSNISNGGTVILNDSTIKNGYPVIINSGTFTANDSNINMDFTNGQWVYAVDNDGTFNINNSKIKDLGDFSIINDEYYGIYNKNSGVINMNSGEITGFRYGILCNSSSTATINLGNNLDSVSKTIPKIESTYSAIYTNHNSNFNFYDGILTGVKDNTIYGTINNIPTNYDINVNKGETTETITLDTKQDRIDNEDYVARIGNTMYVSLEDAVNAVTTSNLTEIVIIKDFETKRNVVIDSSQKIKINFNGHSIKEYDGGVFITNNGELEIDDDSENPKTNKFYSSLFIENNNKLTYNGAVIDMIEQDAKGIVNNGVFTLESGKIYSSNEYTSSMVENNGTFTITDGEVSKKTTRSSAIIDNKNSLTISGGTVKTYEIGYGTYGRIDGNYQLINATETTSVTNISGGTFVKHNPGTWINTSGSLTVTGGIYDSQNQGGTIFGTTSSGTASITGGIYGIIESPKSERFIYNEGTATVENLNIYLYKGFDNRGTLTLTNVTMPKLFADNEAINENRGTLTIKGGEYKTTSSYILDVKTSSTTNLNNTTLETMASGIYNNVIKISNWDQNITGILNINNSTIETKSSAKTSYGRSALYITDSYPIEINIKNSNILSASDYGIYNSNPNVILTIGEQGGVPNQTTPVITGAEYGIRNDNSNATINFYDGIFTGLTNQAIFGTITNIESGYEILERDNGDGTESKYLGISPLLINKETGAEYLDFDSAITEVGVGETLILNRNANILSSINTVNIGSTKNFILDLNGHTLSQGNSLLFYNEGTFTITDDTSTPGGINTSSGMVINNLGTFIFDKGNIYSELGSFGTLVTNSGTMTINEGNLTTNVQTDSMINNTGTIIINGGSIINTSIHEYNNMHLINSTGVSSVVRITGGTFKKNSRGDAFYIEGRLIVTGGSFEGIGARTYGDKDSDCIYNFYIAENAIASITGGTYTLVGSSGYSGMYLIYNAGTTTIENITNSYNKLVRNTGTITFDNVTSTNLTSQKPIYNLGTLTINGGTYTSASSNLIYTENSQNNSTTNINNATITCNNNVIYSGRSGSNQTGISIINIDGSTITDLSSNSSAIYNDSNMTLDIKNSTITSGYRAIFNTGSGSITIGDNTNSVTDSSPLITGNDYGIYSNNEGLIINMYDGEIAGGTKAFNAVINSVPTGYNLVTKQGTTKDTKHLSTEDIIRNNSTGNTYKTFEDAIYNAAANDILVLLTDVTRTETDGPIEVTVGKTIVLDLSDKELISNRSLFEINGELTVNSNNNLGEIFGINANMFTNNNNLTINGGEFYTNDYLKNTIINSGTLTITGGLFKTYKNAEDLPTNVDMFVNNSTGTINISGGEFANGGPGFFINNDGIVSLTGGTYNSKGYYSNGYLQGENLFNNNGTITINNISITGTIATIITNYDTANITNMNVSVGNLVNNLSGTTNITNSTINNGVTILNSARMIINTLTSYSTTNSQLQFGSNSYTEINNSTLNVDNSIKNVNNIIYMDFNTSNVEVHINNSTLTSTGTNTPNLGNENLLDLRGLYNIEINNSTLISGLTSIAINNTNVNSVLTIKGSIIKSSLSNAIYNNGTGTIIIGEAGGTPSASTPSITGAIYGLDNISGYYVYFYDGIISGKTDSIYGIITDVEPGYKEVRNVTTIDSEDYHSSTLSPLGDEDIFAVVDNINFSSLQSAVNYAANNGISNITLYRDVTLESDLVKPVGIINDVYIILGSNTITLNGYNIDSSIHLVSNNEPGLTGAIYKFFASISGSVTNPKNIVIYELEDGSKLEASNTYKLYKYNDGNYDLVMFDEDRIGEYSLGKDTSDMVTVDSRLYLNGIGEGQYRLIGSDLKELDFEIYEDSVSSNIRINRKTRSNYKEFESIATLILTFSTGIIRTPYVLILSLILLITIIGLLLRRKKVQE